MGYKKEPKNCKLVVRSSKNGVPVYIFMSKKELRILKNFCMNFQEVVRTSIGGPDKLFLNDLVIRNDWTSKGTRVSRDSIYVWYSYNKSRDDGSLSQHTREEVIPILTFEYFMSKIVFKGVNNFSAIIKQNWNIMKVIAKYVNHTSEIRNIRLHIVENTSLLYFDQFLRNLRSCVSLTVELCGQCRYSKFDASLQIRNLKYLSIKECKFTNYFDSDTLFDVFDSSYDLEALILNVDEANALLGEFEERMCQILDFIKARSHKKFTLCLPSHKDRDKEDFFEVEDNVFLNELSGDSLLNIEPVMENTEDLVDWQSEFLISYMADRPAHGLSASYRFEIKFFELQEECSHYESV
uniref:F-box domain-containing protein n=1 Tax=Rhabditophanes sp. KR3021 TaxID=114890 RepID=A0AC35U4D5_9BILA